MALFSDDELAAYLQVASVNDDTYELLLALVEGEIVSETGDIDDLTTTQTLTAKAVALEVAARAYRNPRGLTTWSVDDYREGRDASTIGVYLTGSERGRLRRLVADTDATNVGSLVLRPTWRVG